MALIDSIINAESGGNPNARNPHSSASGALRSPHVSDEFWTYALVAKLYLASGPSAVLRAIIAIIIDPINGVLWTRSWTHISKEILKTARPPVTNFDASSTIVFVRSVLWQFTSALHTSPYLVLGSRFATARYRDGHSVRTIGDFGSLNLVATTARCVPGLEIRDRYGDGAAAVTLTGHPPYRRCWPILPDFRLRFRSSDQSAKSHTDIVYALAWGQL